MIDDQKIEELVHKEISEQVAKKLKTFGREAIKSVYQDTLKAAVREFLNSKEDELEKEIKIEIDYNIYGWKNEITNRIAQDIGERIADALSYRESNY